MLDSPTEILQLVASGVVGYLLGSLPFAQWVSRYIKGVDIFSTGTTLAGTANVFWNVGRRSALLVFAGDVGKGSAAIAVAWALQVEAPFNAGGGCCGHPWALDVGLFVIPRRGCHDSADRSKRGLGPGTHRAGGSDRCSDRSSSCEITTSGRPGESAPAS